MASTKFFDAFMAKARRDGEDLYMAALSPEARHAYNQDRQADIVETREKKDWPTRLDHFQTTEEFRAAMADPAYKVNPHYRAKVEAMLTKSAPEIGAQSQPELTPDQQLMQTMRADAHRTQLKQAFRDASNDPVKRLAIAEQLLANPEQADALQAEFSNEGPLQRAIREKGFGHFGSDLGNAMAGSEVSAPQEEGQK